MPASYSIKLDVLRALVAEKKVRLLTLQDAEEAKSEPHEAVIHDLEEERYALPWWSSYPDEEYIDAEIERWQEIINEQRRS